LKRLGDEAYLSSLSSQHRHSAEHVPQARTTLGDAAVVLDWRGLLKPIFNAPKSSLAVIGTAAIILIIVFGPFFLLPLIVLVLFTGPFKQRLKPKHRQKVNQFITRINAYVEERRKTGVSQPDSSTGIGDGLQLTVNIDTRTSVRPLCSE